MFSRRNQELPTRGMDRSLSTLRIEVFSDAVFAIVMTLLVLEIEVPEITEDTSKWEFMRTLFRLWPQFFNYAISFIILGVYWVNHHQQFLYIERTDRTLLWLNILFLMFIAFIPFSTALFGSYPQNYIAIIFYSIHLTLVAILLYIKWIYATQNKRLISDDVPENIIIGGKRKILLGIMIYALTIFVSFFYVNIGIFLFTLVPILYMIPREKLYFGKA